MILESHRLIAYLTLLRPKHWIKNCVCFLPAFCAGASVKAHGVSGAFLSFLAFCLAASFVYIVNDLVDLKRDRLHPNKQTRPLAAGSIEQTEAVYLGACTLVMCVTCALCISPAMLGVIAAYVAMNIWYSFQLKLVAILDAMMISAGFILRLAAGARGAEVKVSAWLILCAFFLSLFLAFGKRRAELNGPDPVSTRRVLGQYTELMLDRFSNIAATLAIATYSVFTVTSRSDHSLLVTCPPVVYGMLRYLLLVETQQEGEAPELILIRDRPIPLTIVLWLISYSAVLYLGLRIDVV